MTESRTPGVTPGADLPSQTTARHVALATVAAGRLAYDASNAVWSSSRSGWVFEAGQWSTGDGRAAAVVVGATQRTLRELRDAELIVFAGSGSGPRPARLAERGQAAWQAWGSSEDLFGLVVS